MEEVVNEQEQEEQEVAAPEKSEQGQRRRGRAGTPPAATPEKADKRGHVMFVSPCRFFVRDLGHVNVQEGDKVVKVPLQMQFREGRCVVANTKENAELLKRAREAAKTSTRFSEVDPMDLELKRKNLAENIQAQKKALEEAQRDLEKLGPQQVRVKVQ